MIPTDMKKDKEKDKESLIKTVLCCWKEDIWLKILSIVSIGLIITSFFLPPQGVVDPSVMLAVGELTGIGCIWEFDKALDKNISSKIKIHEIELEINKQKHHHNIEQEPIEINTEEE